MDGETIGPSGAKGSGAISPSTGLTKEYLLRLIGRPTNDRLRELFRLLNYYTFDRQELEYLNKEILAASSDSARKRMEKEQDEDNNHLI